MRFCPSCGSKVSDDSRFCPNCGKDLSIETVQKPTITVPEVPRRPTGVTIIAILEVLKGVIQIIVGGLLLGFFEAYYDPSLWPYPVFLGAFAFVLGVLFLVLGGLSFLLAYGFWFGYRWAWLFGIILQSIGLISNLIEFPGGLLGLLLNIITLYYLTRPHIKRYFGR